MSDDTSFGLFPDIDDDDFQRKLLQKQEFFESFQENFKYDLSGEGCQKKSELGFEKTPVQRFVGKFLSPQTPYNSVLLYHGVGVGKTCAAITLAEAYLESYPKRKVYIIAPRNIQPGFYKTIFNIDNVRLGIEDGEENTHIGCTDNIYLKLAGVQFERDIDVIEKKVREQIKKRYDIMGYLKFKNEIDKIINVFKMKKLDEKALRERVNQKLREYFSGRMLIIDEAHNLRYSGAVEEGDDADSPGGKDEVETANEGSKLVPRLEQILYAADGIKLALLSGTPMYNSYKDIISLLRLLVINDKKEEISEASIFRSDGSWKPGGEEVLGELARRYVSFMRGENPNQFPMRLKPSETIGGWYETDPAGNPIESEETEDVINLPIVPCMIERDDYREYADSKLEGVGSRIGVITITDLVQAGNCAFPIIEGGNGNGNGNGNGGENNELTETLQFNPDGFDGAFELKNSKYYPTYSAEWMKLESPKFAKSIKTLLTSEGVVFVYSRFVKVGALSYCLFLEANGFMNSDMRGNLLGGVEVDKQCALCSRKRSGHAGSDHTFSQAYYALLTGDVKISTNNERAISLATTADNKDGKKVKVIVGSQIAAEGIDLKYLREIHILDSWLHLNKMEQVIGRGIRFCSHALLEREKRNCTVYMFCNEYKEDDRETIDMYSYRIAYNKSKIIGRVSRVLKENALDCNLNLPAILIKQDIKVPTIDSQGRRRKYVSIQDMPFSPVCDWLKDCEYKCAKPVSKADVAETIDDTTYDMFSQKWKETLIKMKFRELFSRQTHYREEDILEIFKRMSVPDVVLAKIIRDILGNKNFKVSYKGANGYIIYKNGYYLFQPNKYVDLEVPLALRGAMTPVRKESYYPGLFRKAKVDFREVGEGEAKAEAGEGEAGEGDEAGEGEAREGEDREGEEGEEAGEGEAEAEAEAGREPEAGKKVAIWDLAKRWINSVISRPEKLDVPDEFRTEMKRRYAGRERELVLQFEKVETLMWWIPSIKDIEGALADFRSIFLEYIWDEFLTYTEQQMLLVADADEDVRNVAKEENILEIDGKKIFRIRNPSASDFLYICNGKPCARSVIDFIKTNYTLNASVTKESTGEVYGFLTAKNGAMTFKTSVPPGSGKKLPKGQECITVSNSSGKIEMLEKMGAVLLRNGRTRNSLDLVKSIFWKDKNDKSSKPRALSARKLCTLTDIVLRWMDKRGIGEKKWFYRPILSKIAGHVEG